MIRKSRVWWGLYAVAVLGVLMAMSALSLVAVRLDQAEREARRETAMQQSLRLALWRLDSWIAPFLAQEAARPYFEYLSYYPQERAYTRVLNVIQPGEVLTPSPLLRFRSDFFPLHFQWSSISGFTSPQAPTGNYLDLSESSGVAPAEIAAKRDMLERLAGRFSGPRFRDQVMLAEACVALEATAAQRASSSVDPRLTLEDDSMKEVQEKLTQLDYGKRALSNIRAQQTANIIEEPQRVWMNVESASEVVVGPLSPFWIKASATDLDGEPMLVFVRRVQVNDQEILQGLLADWSRLSGAMLGEIEDLFPAATLIPEDLEEATAPVSYGEHRSLATIPASLVPGSLATAAAGSPGEWSLALVALGVTWVAALASILAGAAALAGASRFANERGRFAAAVTHELRTPLTTFRMYSEMLDEEMTPPESRREYVRTLRREAGRLSQFVENVLTHARLEERRSSTPRVRTVEVSELVNGVAAALRRRVEDEGGSFQVAFEETLPAGSELRTDPETVGQILFSLVDNACRHSRAGTSLSVELIIQRRPGRLEMSVRDNGVGVDERVAGRLFRAFSRGDETQPGLGLGLSIARSLARSLGGSLRFDNSAPPGATFTLTLPLSA
ncbi:MAG: sensor histidine kinase [Phycisphaerales bacterium]